MTSTAIPPTKPPLSGHRYCPWLRAVRIDRGWSQCELATESGVSESAVRDIEHGFSAKLTTVQRLAAALGVPTRVLHAPTDEWRRPAGSRR